MSSQEKMSKYEYSLAGSAGSGPRSHSFRCRVKKLLNFYDANKVTTLNELSHKIQKRVTCAHTQDTFDISDSFIRHIICILFEGVHIHRFTATTSHSRSEPISPDVRMLQSQLADIWCIWIWKNFYYTSFRRKIIKLAEGLSSQESEKRLLGSFVGQFRILLFYMRLGER